MTTFWRHGYETTSIVDLTTAMGVSAPSLYAAFGDKKKLFLEAVRLYVGDPEELERRINNAPTAHNAAREMLKSIAAAYTGDSTPKGCLLASATASGSSASHDVQEAIADIRRGVAIAFRKRVERDIADGLLPPHTDAAALAGLVVALTQGLSVLARDGATRSSLLAIVEAAMTGWPTAKALRPL